MKKRETPEQYLRRIFESDAMSDEQWRGALPAYGEVDVGAPGIELHWSPLSWVWRYRNNPPKWVKNSPAERDNWNEALEFLLELHEDYIKRAKPN
jgi:hypothetical protein